MPKKGGKKGKKSNLPDWMSDELKKVAQDVVQLCAFMSGTSDNATVTITKSQVHPLATTCHSANHACTFIVDIMLIAHSGCAFFHKHFDREKSQLRVSRLPRLRDLQAGCNISPDVCESNQAKCQEG